MSEVETTRPDRELARRLWTFVRPHRGVVGLSLVLLPVAAALELAQPLFVRAAIDRHIVPGRWEGLPALVVGLVIVLVVQLAVRYAQTLAMQRSGQLVVRDLRSALFRHVQRLPERYFDRNPLGRTLSRITNDVEGVQEMFAAGVVAIVGDLVTLIGIMAVMIALDWRMALVSFAALPVLVPLVLVLRRVLRAAYRAIRRRVADLTAHLGESLAGMAVVEAFALGERRHGEFRDLNEEYRRETVRAIQADAALFAGVEMMGTLTAAALIAYGGRGIAEGALSFGTLYAFLDYVNKFFVPIRDLSAKYAVIQSAMASSERIFDLLDEPVEARRGAAADPALGSIVFEDVRFSYRPGEEVLRGVSFRLEPGERMAVVGPTGSGKSTLVKLLTGLYPVDSGRILVDGIDVREWSPTELRRRIGVVLQDVFLFSRTLADNVTLGDPAHGEARVAEVVEAVGLGALAARLPEGLATPLGERGLTLSGGERQLVSFARTLAVSPPVLVLDEATSQVDPRTEHLLHRATRTLVEGRTSIVIAHRLATLEGIERILVLARGEVREQGSHAELLERGGLYARLHALQAGPGEARPERARDAARV